MEVGVFFIDFDFLGGFSLSFWKWKGLPRFLKGFKVDFFKSCRRQ